MVAPPPSPRPRRIRPPPQPLDEPCRIDGCPNPALQYRDGMCGAHYIRAHRIKTGVRETALDADIRSRAEPVELLPSPIRVREAVEQEITRSAEVHGVSTYHRLRTILEQWYDDPAFRRLAHSVEGHTNVPEGHHLSMPRVTRIMHERLEQEAAAEKISVYELLQRIFSYWTFRALDETPPAPPKAPKPPRVGRVGRVGKRK